MNKAAAPLTRSANALRNASSYLKYKQAAAEEQWFENFVMIDE